MKGANSSAGNGINSIVLSKLLAASWNFSFYLDITKIRVELLASSKPYQKPMIYNNTHCCVSQKINIPTWLTSAGAIVLLICSTAFETPARNKQTITDPSEGEHAELAGLDIKITGPIAVTN